MSDICEWFTQYIDLAEDVVIIKFSDGTTKTVKRGIYLKEVEDNIRKMLIDQVDRPTGRWIPVSERLPEKDMACLVTVGKFTLTQIAMYSNLMGTIDHRIFWQGEYGKEYFENITQYVKAWMPLPEPYKAETE